MWDDASVKPVTLEGQIPDGWFWKDLFALLSFWWSTPIKEFLWFLLISLFIFSYYIQIVIESS